MNCSEIRKLSDAYADRELDMVRSAEIERHLSGCDPCSQEVENIRALSSALKSPALHFRAPANLRNSIRAATLGKTNTAQPPRRADDERASWTQWLRWLIPVAA